MDTIAFIGLGNMGGGMAANQAKAGRTGRAFDLSEAALKTAADAGRRLRMPAPWLSWSAAPKPISPLSKPRLIR